MVDIMALGCELRALNVMNNSSCPLKALNALNRTWLWVIRITQDLISLGL